ncbi:MAG: pyridoxal phosphate-dependent aminotransferase [Candidatus Adiutrix sp.]|jgi:cystathionine beta-lyase|nr:pyridoxal phosphate-dependent aminotransferase [Candidatus Adiutrix sp.]
MKYNFDEIVPRHGTDCAKYDSIAARGRPADTLPLWVADMDFRCPPEVSARLVELARDGVFGYPDPGDKYFQAVRNWLAGRFGYEPEPEWLIRTPGVVFAVAAAIRALTGPGDAVLIQEPVYHPFAHLINNNGRQMVNNPLVCENGRYRMDFEDFEKKIIDRRVKMFILCSPHNPVGRVWKREELAKVAEICLRHQCLVVSDEIHCDFVRPGHRHLVLPTVAPELGASAVICTAPSKTFNLAGLQAANIFIADTDLRGKFQAAMGRAGYHSLNNMGLAACQAAYEHGADWLEQLKTYLEGNLEYLKGALAGLPGLKIVEPEGSYLIWLDFRELGLNPGDLEELISRRARLWLDEGPKFGLGGQGFYRLNSACPRALLREALERLKAVWPR